MSDAISPILQWFNMHPNLGGIVTFLISAAESIAIVGTIIPGTVTMTALGILVGSGVLPLWSTFIWAITGAIFGDNISYWIGYYFKDGLRNVWPFKQYPQLLNNGEAFFKRYGYMSVVVGRFVGPTRAVVPVVAGMLNMRPFRFILASAVASTGWAPLYMLPGILVGQAALELPPDIAVHMVMVLLITALVILFCLWLAYKILFLIRDQTNNFLNAIWRSLQHSKYFHGVTTLLQHYKKENLHGQLTLAFYFCVVVFLFLYLLSYVMAHPSANIQINHVFFFLFRSLRTPSSDQAMMWITLLGDKKVLAPVIVLILAWLARKKCWRTFYHALGAIALTGLSIVFFKHAAHVIRPWGILHSPPSFSFPSGHATFSTLFYMGILLIYTRATNKDIAKSLYLIISILLAAIGISRLYLGAHWFTDVLGGYLLSSAILMLTVLSYNRKKEKVSPPRAVFASAIAAVMVLSGLLYWHGASKYAADYALESWPTYHSSVKDWWQQQGEHLPVYRIGRVGFPVEVLNLQWVGNLEDIKNELTQSDWESPPDHDWISIIHRLTDVKSTDNLPLLAPLYFNEKPEIELVKYNDDKLIVLRLWRSNLILDGLPSNKQLWVGSLGFVPRTYSWLIHYKNNFEASPNILFTKIPKNEEFKEVQIEEPRKKNHSQTVLFIKPKNVN